MSTIASRLEQVRLTLPSNGSVSLVAVSKFHPAEAVHEAYDAGQRLFAESRVQEIVAKAPLLPADIKWHFIGHLQTNKVGKLLEVPGLEMIESVDSDRLLCRIDETAERLGRTINVLMQVHVAREETKFGMTPVELIEFMRSGTWRSLKATHICGVMGMASNVDDPDRIRSDFEAIRRTRDVIASDPALADLRGFDTVSMGMSGDYPMAVECGSTSVRVGSAIFGPRQY